MTSHFRHRRESNPTVAFPQPVEKGEILVNTSTRQIAVGDPEGLPLALIGVRYFDPKAQYLLNDFVVHQGALYVALNVVQPGAFNAAQWRVASHAADDPSNLASYLLKAGDTMGGPLVLAGPPTTDLGAATKKYVDDATPPPPSASSIPSTATGAIAATNVQAAIAELEAEKVAKLGGTMTGHLSLPTAPAAANAVRKDYVDAADTANATAIAGKVNKAGDTMTGNLTVSGDVWANRGANSGVLYLGSNNVHYLHFDGSNYQMPGGGLGVGGGIAAGAGTFSGPLTSNGGYVNPVNTQHTLYNNGVYFASATPSSIMVQGPPYPTIAFHCVGYFGANFGMSTDGNFYMGGWSHGEGVAYKFWTTRDFGALPVIPHGNPAIGGRLVHGGSWDQSINGGSGRPGSTVLFDVRLLLDYYSQIYINVECCYVQYQVADGNWYTFNQWW